MTNTETKECNECGELTTVRYLDNARRCGFFCLVCVPKKTKR